MKKILNCHVVNSGAWYSTPLRLCIMDSSYNLLTNRNVGVGFRLTKRIYK